MLGLSLALVTHLAAAPAAPDALPRDRVLVVGTHRMTPFVEREPGQAWHGTSVELWREIAEELGLRFQLQERGLDELFHGLEDGSLDVAAAALTVTADREARVDFTHPFFTTGLAIALSRDHAEDWFDTMSMVFSASFFALLVTFAGLQLLVGAIMWLLERRHNPHFQGTPAAGVAAGMWWAVVTMSTVGYGDKVPRSGAGRLLAMVWMLASLVLLTTFTASITTSLTLGRLASKVTGPEDLGKLRVGTVAGSSSETYLRDSRLDFRGFPDAETGMAAIVGGEIDALVYDKPALVSLVAGDYGEHVELLPGTFQRQDYAFALPTGSPLREPINRILARRVADLQVP